MKYKLVTISLTIIIIGLLAQITGCASPQNQATATGNQITTIQRGNLQIDITAAGNLALSTTQDLPFDLFYTQGTVSEVFVKAGDTIKKGQVLASLDQTEWDDQLTALQDKVTAAHVSLLQAQNSLQASQQSLQTAQQNDSTYKLSVLSAQINLDQAQNALDTGITAIDFQSLAATLNRAREWYDYVVNNLQQAPSSSTNEWQLALDEATDQLTVAQTNYDNALAGYDTQETTLKKRQVEVARLQLAQAQRQLNNLPDTIAAATADVQVKTDLVASAQNSLKEAGDALSQARNKNPTIVAPSDGFVTAVNVKGGDYIYKGTVAVQIADPNKFEADIVVGEANILKVKLGGPAMVQLTALPGLTFSGNVTFISPTATIQSGVVNYAVTVEVQPVPLTATSGGGNASSNATGRKVPAAGQQAVQLKDGLTATVNIVIFQKNNVLLVPNAAIIHQGNQDKVQVLLPNGTTEQRVIQVGDTDYKNTEVISGLNEGDKVVIPQASATTSTTTTRSGGGLGIFGR